MREVYNVVNTIFHFDFSNIHILFTCHMVGKRTHFYFFFDMQMIIGQKLPQTAIVFMAHSVLHSRLICLGGVPVL